MAVKRGLTTRQKLFVEYYLIDLNATQAGLRAGYSKKTVGSICSENLTKPEIKDAIQAAMDRRVAKIARTAADVLADIEEVKRDSMQRINGDAMHNPAAALKALELEGKHRKMFTEKIEHTGSVEITKIERLIVNS
jgi:phage terminase small subunit